MKVNFEELDRRSIERECRHTARAGSDARKEYPSSTESGNTLSINEQEFIDRSLDHIHAQISKAKKELQFEEQKLSDIKENIRNDSFNEIAPELKADFNSFILSFKQKLTQQYHIWATSKEQYDSFQTDNNLTRPYSKKSWPMLILSFLLIAL